MTWANLRGTMGLFSVAILGALLVPQVAGVATTHFSFTRLTSKGQPNQGDAFRHASARLGTTTLTFLLSMAWSFVVMIVLMLPSVGLGAGAAALGISDQRGAALALGIIAGLGLCTLVQTFGIGLDPDVYYITHLPVHVEPMEVALVGAAAVVLSYLATIYPALLAARLRPVEGLRYE